MAYMRDSAGRRLDSIAVASRDEITRRSPRILLPFGDSITYLDVGYLSESPATLRAPATAYQIDGGKATGMFSWANYYLGHPLTFIGNAGIPGNTSEDMLARIDAALALPSDIISVMAGANDFGFGFTAARTITALGTIYGRILAAGKRLLVLTTMSRASMSTADGKLYLATVNQWITNYARTTPGVLFADVCSVVTDPNTGVPYNVSTPYPTSDGTHPNAYGSMLMGQVIADALRPVVATVSPFSPSGNADPLNYARNAANLGATGTVANGITGTPGTLWQLATASGTAVAAASKVARTDRQPGEWTRIVIGPANTATIYATLSCWWEVKDGGGNVTQAGFKAGDKVQAAIEVRTTGLTGVTLFQGGTFHPTSQAPDLSGSWQLGAGTLPDGTGVFMVDGTTIGGSATYLSLRVAVAATSGTLDIGRVVARKIG